jgi:hypothetical protein
MRLLAHNLLCGLLSHLPLNKKHGSNPEERV